MAILNKGLLQLYTGLGKGKTTAAFGLAWRMLGQGGRVYICQFLKPQGVSTGEAALAEQFTSLLTLDRLENRWDMPKIDTDTAQRIEMAQAIAIKLRDIGKIMAEGLYDLVILDEILFCLSISIADLVDVYDILDGRARHVEIVLTGRNAPQELIDRADLVTEMKAIKHPFHSGIHARAGIEF